MIHCWSYLHSYVCLPFLTSPMPRCKQVTAKTTFCWHATQYLLRPTTVSLPNGCQTACNWFKTGTSGYTVRASAVIIYAYVTSCILHFKQSKWCRHILQCDRRYPSLSDAETTVRPQCSGTAHLSSPTFRPHQRRASVSTLAARSGTNRIKDRRAGLQSLVWRCTPVSGTIQPYNRYARPTSSPLFWHQSSGCTTI